MFSPDDDLLGSWLLNAAAEVVGCEQRYDALYAAYPESPAIADEDRPSALELAARDQYLALCAAWRADKDAAKSDMDAAQARSRDAHRLATGVTLDAGAATLVMAYAVNARAKRGSAPRRTQDTTTQPITAITPARTGTRTRGAGRPKATASRSSAASGDSGDSDPEPPRPRRPWRTLLVRLLDLVRTGVAR